MNRFQQRTVRMVLSIPLLLLIVPFLYAQNNTTPYYPGDFYVSLHLNNPAEGAPFAIEGKIFLPDSNYVVESLQQTFVEDSLIQIDISIQKKNDNPNPTKAVIEHFVFAMSGLKTGVYTVVVMINHMPAYKEAFLVGNIQFPTPVPRPTPPFYEPKIEIIPPDPTINDDVTARVTGLLPDAAHYISDVSVEYRMEMILLNMRVETSGRGAEVLTPATQEFVLGKLAANGYAAMLMVNGIDSIYTKFIVQGDPVEPVIPIFNPMHVKLEIIPPNPQPNEEFTIYLVGEFPTPGYLFLDKKIEVQDGAIMASIIIQEPTDPVIDVMTPFTEPLKTLSLAEGIYKIETMINHGLIEPYRLIVGNPIDPINSRPDPEDSTPDTGNPGNVSAYNLTFRVEGGFAGVSNWLTIGENNNYSRYNQFISARDVENGSITETQWNSLNDCLNRSNFTALASVYKPKQEILDGFVYVIEYNNKSVTVFQGAEIPPALDETIQLLNTIMNTPVEKSEWTGIKDWGRY